MNPFCFVTSSRLSLPLLFIKIASVRGGEDFIFAAGFRKIVENLEPYAIIDITQGARNVLLAAVDLLDRRMANQKMKAEREARAKEAAKASD